MTYSKKTLYIVQKLDAINGAINNIKQQECETETAIQLSIALVKHLHSERDRLVHELELIANSKSIRAAGKAGLPVQNSFSTHRYQARQNHQHNSQIVLH